MITDSYNSSVINNRGAIHVYDNTGKLIRSIYGERENTFLGSMTPVLLPQNRFAIISIFHSTLANVSTGGVFVYNSDGIELYRVEGDNDYDRFGSKGVKVLPNGNLAIVTSGDYVSGKGDAGSLKVINGTTGEVIFTVSGNDSGDQLGYSNFLVLPNGNIVLNSPYDDIGAFVNAGSAKLINGVTGVEIASINGSGTGAYLSYGGSTYLSNGNFVINSPDDDIPGFAGVGSVKIVNGTSGIEVGAVYGDNADDSIGNYGVVALPSGNFLVISSHDDIGVATNAGSVKIINGLSGSEMGSINGNDSNDNLGTYGVTVLSDGNFIISSPNDDILTASNAGSVKLINSTTGLEIASINGDDLSDSLGSGGVTALANGNFIISSRYDNIPGFVDAGSVKIINGVTGAEIASINGDDANDNLGSGVVTILPDGNFVINSQYDRVNGDINAGSVKIINSNSGAVIASIDGDNAHDSIGSGGVAVLPNGNFVVISPNEDFPGRSNTGAVKRIDATDGTVISSVEGGFGQEHLVGSNGVTVFSNGNFLVKSSSYYASFANAGAAELVAGD